MQTRFTVNAPTVVSEIIDGEVVIMNLKTGKYFSIEQVGVSLWEWLEAGHALPDLVDLAVQRYTGDRAAIEAAIGAFVEELLKLEILKPSDAPRVEPTLVPTEPQTPFVDPVISVYSDMEDLLLLDPIHDVDTVVGWPTRPEPGDTR